MNDLIGRKFHFERDEKGNIHPTKELPSATWQMPDGQILSVEGPSITHERKAEVDNYLQQANGAQCPKARKMLSEYVEKHRQLAEEMGFTVTVEEE